MSSLRTPTSRRQSHPPEVPDASLSGEGLIVLSALLNLPLSVALLHSELPALGAVGVGFVGLAALGLALIFAGERRAGAVLVLIGGAAFFPLGVVGMLGARKVLDRVGVEAFRAAVPVVDEWAMSSTVVIGPRDARRFRRHAVTPADFYVNPFFPRLWFALGAVFCVLGGAALVGGGSAGPALGVGGLLLCQGAWMARTPVVRLHGDHLEVKAAPLAGRQLIRYRDIVEMETGEKTVLHVRTDGGQTRIVRLPLKQLEAHDTADLLLSLRGATGQA